MDVNTIAVTYAGKLLQDDATMGSAKVGKEAIIHIMLRKAPAPAAKKKCSSMGSEYSESSYSSKSSTSSPSCPSSSSSSSTVQPAKEDKVTEEMLISSFASGASTKGIILKLKKKKKKKKL